MATQTCTQYTEDIWAWEWNIGCATVRSSSDMRYNMTSYRDDCLKGIYKLYASELMCARYSTELKQTEQCRLRTAYGVMYVCDENFKAWAKGWFHVDHLSICKLFRAYCKTQLIRCVSMTVTEPEHIYMYLILQFQLFHIQIQCQIKVLCVEMYLQKYTLSIVRTCEYI